MIQLQYTPKGGKAPMKLSKKQQKQMQRAAKKAALKQKRKQQKALEKQRIELKKAKLAQAERIASAKKARREAAKKKRSEAAKKGWDTRRKNQEGSRIGIIFDGVFVKTNPDDGGFGLGPDSVGEFDYGYFSAFPDAQQDAGDGYPYIYHLFVLDDDAPGDWDHVFTEDEILKGKGSGFAWAAEKI